MEPNELKYWLFFSQTNVVGPVRFKKLLDYFPDLATAYQAGFNELKQAGLEENVIEAIKEKKKEIDPEKTLADLTKENIQAITIKDALYPKLLKEIFHPPALLYYQGEFKEDDSLAIAIVGTRQMTAYGQKAVMDIASELAKRGLTIVSGLALGIDTTVHETALENHGRTIAVIGSGLDQPSIYPPANKLLAKKIVDTKGLMLSEFPPQTLPLPQHFPQRNRIISGLSLATLVIEAGELSGALITARFALEQNRDVLALPGSIYNPMSLGPNNLIKMGAKPITDAQEILEALNLTTLSP